MLKSESDINQFMYKSARDRHCALITSDLGKSKH